MVQKLVSAREIFMGFCKYYNSLNIIWDESISTHTGRILSFFDELGRMLGYRILSENMLKNLVSPCPDEMSNKKIDMIWWRFDENDKPEYVLAIESQQSAKRNLIEKDINKLVILPAKLRVLYCSAKEVRDILELIRDTLGQVRDVEGSFLAIVDPWVSADDFSKGTLRAYLLDEKGSILSEGSAIVEEVIDGTHNIRMFLEAKWQ